MFSGKLKKYTNTSCIKIGQLYLHLAMHKMHSLNIEIMHDEFCLINQEGNSSVCTFEAV